MRGLICLLFVCIFFLNIPARASKFIEYYCKKELKELCTDNPHAFQCIKKFPDKRSEKCKAAFAAYEKELNAFYGPCLGEKENNCLELEPGMGLIGPCLNKIVEKVSPECAKQIKMPYPEKFPDMPFDAQAVCANELKKYCPGVQYGKFKLSKCLKIVEDKITAKDCKAAVEQIQ